MYPVDRSHAPKIQDFTLFRPQKPEALVLGNDIPLKVFKNPQLDLLHFIIKIKAGSLYESKKNAAVFCYLLLKESSKQYSSSEVDEFLDYYGVNYTASLSIEYASINLVIPKQNYAKVLPYIFDFLAHPVFKEQNIEILRKRKLMDLAYNREKVSYCASQLMLHHIFGDSCMTGKILEESDINSITAEDLYEHHRKTFCAENIRVFAAGNIDDELCQSISSLFGSIPHGKALALASQPITVCHPEPIVDKHQDCLQSSFYLCRKSLGYTDPKRMDFSVLSTILGGYFGSRLMSNLRETHGYTYGINCDSLYFENSSIFYIESEVNVDVTRQAIDECFKEIERLCHEPVPAEEIGLVQNYMAGQLLRKVDNSVSYMTQYSRWNDAGCNESEFERQMHSIKSFDGQKSMLLAQQLMQKNDFITIISGNIN
jgi:predicted Zn-dependent peptidase